MRKIMSHNRALAFGLLLAALFLFVSCDNGNNSRPTSPIDFQQAAADFIASQVLPNPDFVYEQHFDPQYRKDHTEKEVKDLLVLIRSRYGDCIGAVPASDQVGDDGRRNWFLMFDDRRVIMQLYADPQDGLIRFYALTGSIPPEEYFRIEQLMVPMHDGVRLRTLVFQKAADRDARPTVLLRTPYFESNGLFNVYDYYGTAEYFLERGYRFIAQSIRGKAGSEGVYKYFHPVEIDDGYDAVMWVAAQPFCNGCVGITGNSYDGFTSLAAGIRNPAPLKVVMAGGAPSNIATDGFRFNGPMITTFLNFIAYNELQQGYFPEVGFREKVKEICLNETDLRDYDERVYGADLAEWNRIAEAYPDPDAAFWKEREIFSRLPEIRIPTWHIAGMNIDGDLPDTVRNFAHIQDNSPFANNHRMIIGYWGHGNNTPYGNGNNLLAYWKDRYDPIMAFFLKGAPTEYINERHVQMAASHTSEDFIVADQWPMPQLHEETLFFNRNGDVFTLDGNQNGNVDESGYTFKPLQENTREMGDEQALCFKWSPTQKVSLLGPVLFRIYVSIDVPQTDIFVLFEKRNAKNEIVFFTNLLSTQKVVNTDGVMLLELTGGPVMNVMEPGETLSVQILSNFFPVMFRNRNNEIGPDYYDSLREAQITVYHSAQYPSRVTLSYQ